MRSLAAEMRQYVVRQGDELLLPPTPDTVRDWAKRVAKLETVVETLHWYFSTCHHVECFPREDEFNRCHTDDCPMDHLEEIMTELGLEI